VKDCLHVLASIYIDIQTHFVAGDAWDVEDGSDRLLVTYGDDADSFDVETQVGLLCCQCDIV
jgi:hypothetical protein